MEIGGGGAADGGGAAGAEQTGITRIAPKPNAFKGLHEEMDFKRLHEEMETFSREREEEEEELLESIVKRVRDVADALKVRASNAVMFNGINRTPSCRRLQPSACLTPMQPVSFLSPPLPQYPPEGLYDNERRPRHHDCCCIEAIRNTQGR